MIKFRLLISILLIFISNNLWSANISVIDIEYLIDTNKSYKKIINEIEDHKSENYLIIKSNEEKLDKLYEEIESSKLFLDEKELNKKIINYNNELTLFNKFIDDYNSHFQNELLNIRKIILEEIIVIVEKYAKINNIDLIIDSTSYIIASNSIDITGKIREKLNEINLNLEFKSFEKN